MALKTGALGKRLMRFSRRPMCSPSRFRRMGPLKNSQRMSSTVHAEMRSVAVAALTSSSSDSLDDAGEGTLGVGGKKDGEWIV